MQPTWVPSQEESGAEKWYGRNTVGTGSRRGSADGNVSSALCRCCLLWGLNVLL